MAEQELQAEAEIWLIKERCAKLKMKINFQAK